MDTTIPPFVSKYFLVLEDWESLNTIFPQPKDGQTLKVKKGDVVQSLSDTILVECLVFCRDRMGVRGYLPLKYLEQIEGDVTEPFVFDKEYAENQLLEQTLEAEEDYEQKIAFFQEQTGCTRNAAVRALEETEECVVTAILKACDEPDDIHFGEPKEKEKQEYEEAWHSSVMIGNYPFSKQEESSGDECPPELDPTFQRQAGRGKPLKLDPVPEKPKKKDKYGHDGVVMGKPGDSVPTTEGRNRLVGLQSFASFEPYEHPKPMGPIGVHVRDYHNLHSIRKEPLCDNAVIVVRTVYDYAYLLRAHTKWNSVLMMRNMQPTRIPMFPGRYATENPNKQTVTIHHRFAVLRAWKEWRYGYAYLCFEEHIFGKPFLHTCLLTSDMEYEVVTSE